MTTSILSLPEIAESQASKYLTHNEALYRLEGLLVRVLSATTTAEPVSPAEGDVYIVPASATGTNWAGQDGKVAHYYGGVWHFYDGVDGLTLYSIGDDSDYRYATGTWSAVAGGGGASAFTGLTDTPANYTGQSGKVAAVKATEDGLEFIDQAGGGTAPTFLELLTALGPQRHWRLGESTGTVANEEIASDHGAYESLPTLGIAGFIAGDADTAVDFASASKMRITGGGSLFGAAGTVFFMVKPSWSAGDSLNHLMFDAGGGTTNYFRIQKFNDNIWYIGWVNGGVNYRAQIADSAFEFVAGTVYSFAVTWDDAADETIVYVDGVQVGQNVGVQSYPTISADAMLNGRHDGSEAGDMAADELLLFSTALSAEQITDLSNTALYGPQPALEVIGRNYLLNPDFALNQRGFAGGALADGVYGYDRWKASGASDISTPDASGYVTLTSGAIEQVIEAPDLGGKQVTLAAETGGTTVTGTIDGQSGPLPLTVIIAAGSTGDIAVSLSGGKVKNVRLVQGANAGTYQPRDHGAELALCQRYYQKSYAPGVAPGTVVGGGRTLHTASTNAFMAGGWTPLHRPMRATPTMTLYAPSNGSAGNIDRNSTPEAAAMVNISAASGGYPQLTATTPAPADFCTWHWTADAEL